MIELPRITRALRAHTQLDKPRCLKPTADPTKPVLLKKKSLQRYVQIFIVFLNINLI